MEFINKKKEERKAKVGDFIFADGELYVITKTYDCPKILYESVFVIGNFAFNGAGITRDSIEEIIDWYKDFDDFELIKNEEMQLVRK